MKKIQNWLIFIAIIGAIYVTCKIYVQKTTDPTFKIGADSIQWKDQRYGHGNRTPYELGSFVCRNSEGYKLYEIEGDTAHQSVVVLFPGFMGRYYKYTRE